MPDVFFSDDSRQSSPSRERMGPLVASGFLHVPSEHVRDLERAIGAVCDDTGFPHGQQGEFKWSPGRELWMRRGVVGEARTEFFLAVLNLASEAEASVSVVICDESRGTATGCADHSLDVSRLLIERVEWRLTRAGRHGVIVVDRPSGDRAAETEFLAACLETITEGTDYLTPDRIAFNVVSSPSRLIRCLQLADLVVSATTSFVAGESEWSPTVFPAIRSLMGSDGARTGGVGLKLHPDFVYANLYHWLLNDSHWWRRNTGIPLPVASQPYATNDMAY